MMKENDVKLQKLLLVSLLAAVSLNGTLPATVQAMEGAVPEAELTVSDKSMLVENNPVTDMLGAEAADEEIAENVIGEDG